MGFLKLNTVNVLGHMILHYRGTTLYYRMFSDVPDLGSNNTTPICDNQKCLQVWPSVPWKEESKSTQVRTTAIKRLKGFYLFFIFIFLQTCQFILFYFIFYFILLYNTVLVFNTLSRFVIALLDLMGIYFCFFLRNLHTIPGKFSRDFIVNWYI